MSLELTWFIDIDDENMKYIKYNVLEENGLVLRSISDIDRSFERALSICLFGSEQELQSISSTLCSQYDW